MLYKHIRDIGPTLDKENKFMFFEIKKSAITSVRRRSLKDRAVVRKDSWEKYYEHFDKYSNEDIDNIFKFTIIRNPFERYVSTFFYLRKYEKINRIAKFKQFTKTIFKERNVDINFHFHRMSDKVCFDGEVFVDFVARLENIEKDWQYISEQIGNSNPLPHFNKTEHQHYRTYYDSACVKIVENIYSEDLKIFGYHF